MPAVAAVEIVFGAILALILIVAFYQLFRPLLTAALSQLPYVGGWVAGHQDAILLSAYLWAARWALASVTPLADLFRRFRLAWFQYTDKVVRSITATYLALWRVQFHLIPWVQAQLTLYSRLLFGQANTYAQQLHEQETRYAQQLHDQAIAYIQKVQAQDLEYARLLAVGEARYAEALHDQETRYAQALEAEAIRYAQEVGQRDTAYAQTLQAQALGFTRDAFGRSIEFEEKLYGQAVGFAERVGQLDRTYAQQVGAQAIAYAAAATGVIAADLAALRNEPCIRFCNALGGLGSFLQDLEDVAIALLLLEMARQLAHDPRGAAQALESAGGAAVRGVQAGIADLVGLRAA